MLSSRITETIEESQIKIDLTHINVPKGCVDGGVGVCQNALIYSTHPIEVFAFIDDGVGNYMIETMGLDTILQAIEMPSYARTDGSTRTGHDNDATAETRLLH